MHEMSLAQNIFTIANREKEKNSFSKITKITISIGEFSNISKPALDFALNTLKNEYKTHAAIFEIKTIKAILECNDCNKKSELKEYKFRCSQCNSNNVSINSGDEMVVESIEGCI